MNIGIIILIGIIVTVLYLYFKSNKANENNVHQNKIIPNLNNETQIGILELEEDLLIDEEGRKYKEVIRTREIQRKTYILGDLNGKYWGEIDAKKEAEFVQHKFFNFNIYEVIISNALTQTDKPFDVKIINEFPRERFPKSLVVHVIKDGKEYELNLHEITFVYDENNTGVKFNRKLHQDEGNEVFGTIDTKITGYVLDFIKEEYLDRIYLENNNKSINIPQSIKQLNKTLQTTGNTNYKDGYLYTEYYFDDFKTTYWDKGKFKKTTQTNHSNGCFSSILGFLSLIIGVAFLILMLPQIGILLPIIAILFLLKLIPSTIWNWIIRIFAGFILLAFFTSIFYSISNSSSNYIPKKYTEDAVNEKTDTLKRITEKDTVITHFRSWRDYDNNLYEGSYFVKYSIFQNAKNFKNSLPLVGSNQFEYDKILYSLKENDKNNLQSLFLLFDTLKITKKLDSIAFAKMIVSFVQDIPYALVLPKDCDPNLYSDNFIKQYLFSKNAKCDGYEKYGINSPVEFLTTLNGDCDTRTLLLYTIFTHYNYDVVLLSSEVYNHSIFGVNLPLEGKSYDYGNQKYILWETTSPHIEPGLIPLEISNINNWRISLKSK